MRHTGREVLKKDIALGVEQMVRNESVSYASGEELARDIQAKGREILASRKRNDTGGSKEL